MPIAVLHRQQRPLRPSRAHLVAITPGHRAAVADPRWPEVMAALALLRGKRHRAVRIVDADCGAGGFLVEVAREARALGFTSIEARGIDGSPALIGRARAAAARLADPAIGLSFEAADMVAALRAEAEAPADIVLWHGAGRRGGSPAAVAAALAGAGRTVIGDAAPLLTRAAA